MSVNQSVANTAIDARHAVQLTRNASLTPNFWKNSEQANSLQGKTFGGADVFLFITVIRTWLKRR